MLRMRFGLRCLTAVEAIVSMAEKLKQACMNACSTPLTRKWSRRSHSLALLNNLSTLTLFLKRLTRRLAPWTTKSRPTFKACLILELFLCGMTGSAPNALTVSLTLDESYWASAKTVLAHTPCSFSFSSNGLMKRFSFKLQGSTVKARGSSELVQHAVWTL